MRKKSVFGIPIDDLKNVVEPLHGSLEIVLGADGYSAEIDI